MRVSLAPAPITLTSWAVPARLAVLAAMLDGVARPPGRRRRRQLRRSSPPPERVHAAVIQARVSALIPPQRAVMRGTPEWTGLAPQTSRAALRAVASSAARLRDGHDELALADFCYEGE